MKPSESDMLLVSALASALLLKDVSLDVAMSKITLPSQFILSLEALKVNNAKIAEDDTGTAVLFMKDRSLVKISSDTRHPDFWTSCRSEFFSDQENMCELTEYEDIHLFYSFVHEDC